MSALKKSTPTWSAHNKHPHTPSWRIFISATGGRHGRVYLASPGCDAVAEGITACEEGEQLLPARWWGQLFTGTALGPLPLFRPWGAVSCASVGPASPWVQCAVTEYVVHRHFGSFAAGKELQQLSSDEAPRKMRSKSKRGGGRAHLGKVTASPPEFHKAKTYKPNSNKSLRLPNPSDCRMLVDLLS